MKITFVVGARPNFMKTAPVVAALKTARPDATIRLLHTGQHYDAHMSDVFVDELGLPPPAVFLGVGSGSHGEQTARALVGVEADLLEHRPDLVVVPGDVNSTLAGALAAVKVGVPVCHLEAGLRSFDPAMPEEHNRRLTDHVSSLLLTHCQDGVDNLLREGVSTGVHLVGNTMIDSLLAYLDRAVEARPWEAFGLSPEGFCLVTLHRPSLVDDREALDATVRQLAELANEHPVVFPVHPRTHDRLGHIRSRRLLDRLVVSRPLPYLTFLGLQARASFVLTDSGGVQEETSALGVPCFTLRDTTERPVTVALGTNTLLGKDPAAIEQIPGLLAGPRRSSAIPLWDGHASLRACQVIVDWLAGDSG